MSEFFLTLPEFDILFPKVENSQYVLKKLNEVSEKYDINTYKRYTNFLAQLAHESCGFRVTVENLNYSAQGLLSVFPKYFNYTTAARYAKKPQMIANRVYANRLGNGNEASGDGWRYRGRGYIQLTGKYNYERISQLLNYDFVSRPDDLTKISAASYSAAEYWKSRNLNQLADNDDIINITKRINGGTVGLTDRKNWLTKIRKQIPNV